MYVATNRDSYTPGLGIAPAVGVAAINLAATIFGNSGQYTAQYKGVMDALLAQAQQGDRCALVKLMCLSGGADGVAARPEAIQCGWLTADELARQTPCGAASAEKRAYARGLVQIVLQGAASGATATPAGTVVVPDGSGGYTLSTVATSPMQSSSTYLLLGVGLVAAYLLMGQRRS
jgi:hypothetical protein